MHNRLKAILPSIEQQLSSDEIMVFKIRKSDDPAKRFNQFVMCKADPLYILKNILSVIIQQSKIYVSFSGINIKTLVLSRRDTLMSHLNG